MLALIAAFVCGVIFGWGLVISGMTQPAKVLGFLDVFGTWDPTLAIVMAAALAVTWPAYVFAKRRPQPFYAPKCLWPTNTIIDRRLVAGSALFGIGWGLVGLCPGPALTNLASLSPRVAVFVIAMGLGMLLQDFWRQRRPVPPPLEEVALAVPSDG
jgi:uncharacterized protein